MSKGFEQILTDHGPMLSRLASSYEANHHLHQELLQEISVAVWQALKGFRADSSLRTYILRVAHNKAVNHVAYHARQPRNDSYCEVSQPLPSHVPSFESSIGQNQQVQKLLSEVRKLPLQARQIVTMSMEGLSYQEIAEVCGLTTSNIGVILNRAKKSLLESMHDDE